MDSNFFQKWKKIIPPLSVGVVITYTKRRMFGKIQIPSGLKTEIQPDSEAMIRSCVGIDF